MGELVTDLTFGVIVSVYGCFPVCCPGCPSPRQQAVGIA